MRLAKHIFSPAEFGIELLFPACVICNRCQDCLEQSIISPTATPFLSLNNLTLRFFLFHLKKNKATSLAVIEDVGVRPI
jgi:hypothetical protein